MINPYSKQTETLILLHYRHLSEKDRRHYAAIEAVKLGRGGISYISKILGVSRTTIIAGKKELQLLSECGQIPLRRQRKAGGGRKKNGKTS
jgi:predicted transcriptional regulator